MPFVPQSSAWLVSFLPYLSGKDYPKDQHHRWLCHSRASSSAVTMRRRLDVGRCFCRRRFLTQRALCQTIAALDGQTSAIPLSSLAWRDWHVDVIGVPEAWVAVNITTLDPRPLTAYHELGFG